MHKVHEKAGRRAEAWAALFMRFKGYSLLERRYRSPVGEIDLIMKRGKTLVFVEVKKRQDMETALWSIRPRQRQRLRRAAGYFIAKTPSYQDWTYRFDAVFIVPFQWPRHIKHISDGLE